MVTRNKDVRDSIALVAHTSVSNLSILFARALLTSPQLPDLVQRNAMHLAAAYDRVRTLFEDSGIEYLPCEAATFVLARLAPHSQTRDDEKAAVDFYQRRGVLFFSATDDGMPSEYKGWMRVSFAIEPERLEIAIGRIREAYQAYIAS